MLTYGPGMRVTRVLTDSSCRSVSRTSQPEANVTGAWDMADLTYNQGIHGAQDTANVMVRAGRPFHVVTDDWRAPSFPAAIGAWAHAAAAVTRWRSLKVAIFGGTMNGMGTSVSTSTRCSACSVRWWTRSRPGTSSARRQRSRPTPWPR